jgi:hypothetical protein
MQQKISILINIAINLTNKQRTIQNEKNTYHCNTYYNVVADNGTARRRAKLDFNSGKSGLRQFDTTERTD